MIKLGVRGNLRDYRSLLLVLTVAWFLAAPHCCFGDDDQLAVFLVSAPRAITGIGVLGPNDFPAYQAYYKAPGDPTGIGLTDPRLPLDEAAAVRATFTARIVPIPGEWTSIACGEFTVRLVAGAGAPWVCYAARDWTVFLAFKEEYFWWRDFVAGFIRGLRFFLSFAQSNEIPFPAVVEVPAQERG